MRTFVKLLPFFVVEWLARRDGNRVMINGWMYAQAFGPGTKRHPQLSVLIEVDVDNRDWYA